MLIQVVSRNKFVGFVMVMSYYLIISVLYQLGLEDGLFRPNAIPSYTYSDINGYGPFLTSVLWFTLYWGLFAAILALVSNLFWQRGAESGPKAAYRRAKERLSPTIMKAGVGVFVTAFLCVGGFIFYNTHGLPSRLRPISARPTFTVKV